MPPLASVIALYVVAGLSVVSAGMKIAPMRQNRNSAGTSATGSEDRFASMTSTRPAVRTIAALAVALGLALTGCTPANPND
ncbi:hypothetical protein DN540_41300, partial [Burkholderia multivorans]